MLMRCLLCLLCAEALFFTSATDIRWTSNDGDKNDPAATAPRSQRYWDENGIERPDYAKTDAEIAAEQGKRPVASLLGIFTVTVCFGLSVGWYLKQKIEGGDKLGTGRSGIFSSPGTGFGKDEDDSVRRARLARFQGKLD